MTTRYRVEYALKTHRRDQFIEWIKGLLAVPFVLHAQPTLAYEGNPEALVAMAQSARRRYTEVLRDVEQLVTDQSERQILRECRHYGSHTTQLPTKTILDEVRPN